MIDFSVTEILSGTWSLNFVNEIKSIYTHFQNYLIWNWNFEFCKLKSNLLIAIVNNYFIAIDKDY